MIRMSVEKVKLLHQLMAEETGGSVGVRDEGLLDSAIQSIYQTFGNKRIGMHVMLTFLEVNGIRLECTNEDIVKAGLGVASGEMDYEDLLAWVKNHKS